MSYSFQVEVKDGQLTASSSHLPSVPDGKFIIGGHEDADWLSVSVTRNNEAGAQVAQATGYGRRAQ